MSDGEIALSVFSTMVAAVAWITWYVRLAGRRAFGHGVPGKGVLLLAPLACAALIFIVLRTVASFDVINDYRYIYQYFALGMAWTGVCTGVFSWFGISARDDVFDRRNPAAVPVLSGGLLGFAACYSGGNIGDGPGWWVVIFAALLASGTLAVLWLILERFTHVSDAITIDRDIAAGHRLGGFLFGAGLILGRGVAGDWVSPGATIADFVQVAWPAVLLLVLFLVIDRQARATPEQPEPSVQTVGLMPAMIYTILGAAYVAMLGMPQ